MLNAQKGAGPLKDYPAITKNISRNLKTLRADIAPTMQGFSAMSQSAVRSGALDRKTKELIALAIGVAKRCDGCIGFHGEALVKRPKNPAFLRAWRD